MDALLHHGQYAVELENGNRAATSVRVSLLNRLCGIDRHFSRSDRWITQGIFWWSIFWFVVFVVGSLTYLIYPWSSALWADFWLIQAIYLPLGIAVVTAVWFTVGCIHDLRIFFHRLKEEKVDLHDDGVVKTTITDVKKQMPRPQPELAESEEKSVEA